MKRIFAFVAVAGLVSFSIAAKAPSHHSLRAEAMGNAHVAVADDKEAIYFNYAGLTQINRLGNYEKRPEQGSYPRNLIGDMRLNLAGAGPFEKYFSTFNDVKELQKLYQRVSDAGGGNGALLDSLGNHPELVDLLNSYDHKRLDMSIKLDAELAVHGFGGAVWVSGGLAPYLDGGLLLPYMVVDTFYVDAVAQAGFSYGFTDQLSVGIGGKIAKRQKINALTIGILDYETLQDTLTERYTNALDELFNFESISIGMDIGVLYQWTREFRVGASLRDIYFKELAGDSFIPNFSFGLCYSPKLLNKNTAFGRKFNIAMDYADAFNSDKNYKPLTHINFGVELEQTLLAWPGYNNELRALTLRLSGGFKGGYPTAGIAVEALRIVTLELATWAEERGYYTGQDEERVYIAELSLGF